MFRNMDMATMRKLLAFLFVLLLSPLPAFASFGSATNWDVRTTGVDTDGGAFDSGVVSPGTDESQGSGTSISIVLTGTTTGTGTPVFSATTNGPGNFVHIASGSGCTTGWYEILSQATGVATFDHAMGTSTDVCVGTIGGSLLTIQTADGQTVGGNTVNIQSGTYTWTSTYTVHVTTAAITWLGYQTTHGDGGTRPLITTATNSTRLINTGLSTAGMFVLWNVSLSNTAATNSDAIWQQSVHCTGGSTWVFNHDLFTGFAISINDEDSAGDEVCLVSINGTEITGSTTIGVQTGGGTTGLIVRGSYFHANLADVNASGNALTGINLLNSIFAGATINGAAVGINPGASNISTNTVQGCAFYGVTTSGSAALFFISNAGFDFVSNNIFYGNYRAIAGDGIAANVARNYATSKNNAFGNNTVANSSFLATPSDITLTANPFVSASTGNFALNTTSGGGALLRAAAYPGAFGTTTTNYLDVGAAQSQGSAGTTAANYGDSH